MDIPTILQQLSGKTLSPMMQSILPQINKYRSLFNMIQNSGNPQAMMQQVLQQQPQFREVQQLINGANGDPRLAFYRLCERRGINPQEFIDALK